MSLNKTLDRLFDEIRREAKRNPDFANRLDAVLRLHDSRRDVPEGVVEDVAAQASAPASAGVSPAPVATEGAGRKRKVATPPPAAARPIGLNINPVGLFKRDGESALAAVLADQDAASLQALIAEHNLDPAGLTEKFDRGMLADYVVAAAKGRAARDEKMFDY